MRVKRRISRGLCMAVLIVCTLAILLYEIFLSGYDTTPGGMLGMTVTRALGAVIFLVVLLYSEYRVTAIRPYGRAWLGVTVFVAALLIALNNFPWLALASGQVRVTGSVGELLLLGAECLCIALFEEMTFRGVLFLRLLEKRRENSRQIFFVTVVSSALFGLVHLLNLLEGASPFSVLLQIGYSFLIGGMCAIVLLKTGCLWLAVLVHAVYDYGGNLIPVLGEGKLWDTPTVVITAVFSVIVVCFMLTVLARVKPEETDRFYPDAGR